MTVLPSEGGHILIVDDMPENLRILALLLERNGLYGASGVNRRAGSGSSTEPAGRPDLARHQHVGYERL